MSLAHPTAWHHSADSHETPNNQLPSGPELGVTDQVVPFHDSVKVFETAVFLPINPTA